MSYTSKIWLYPPQDWWKTVNEMSNIMSTEQMGNFIFRPELWYVVTHVQQTSSHSHIVMFDLMHLSLLFGLVFDLCCYCRQLFYTDLIGMYIRIHISITKPLLILVTIFYSYIQMMLIHYE